MEKTKPGDTILTILYIIGIVLGIVVGTLAGIGGFLVYSILTGGI